LLFFLLSGLFLSLLLGAIERSRKLLAVSGVCLVAVVCIIVLLTPVQLPNLGWFRHEESGGETAATSTTVAPVVDQTSPSSAPATSTTGSTTPTDQIFTVTTTQTTAPIYGPIDGTF
jgi:hypothetical protein